MTHQDKILEQTRNSFKNWNDSRAKNEVAALDKFYSLKRLFDAEKKHNTTKPVNQ